MVKNHVCWVIGPHEFIFTIQVYDAWGKNHAHCEIEHFEIDFYHAKHCVTLRRVSLIWAWLISMRIPCWPVMHPVTLAWKGCVVAWPQHFYCACQWKSNLLCVTDTLLARCWPKYLLQDLGLLPFPVSGRTGLMEFEYCIPIVSDRQFRPWSYKLGWIVMSGWNIMYALSADGVS